MIFCFLQEKLEIKYLFLGYVTQVEIGKDDICIEDLNAYIPFRVMQEIYVSHIARLLQGLPLNHQIHELIIYPSINQSKYMSYLLKYMPKCYVIQIS